MPSAPRGRRIAIFLTSALVALAATGVAACGQSEEDKVRDVLTNVNDAAKSGDTGELCGLLADDALEQAYGAKGDEGKKNCEETLGQNVDALKKDAEGKFEIKDVKIDGDNATATVTDAEKDNPVKLRKVDGDWKIGRS